jgi:hypothetical protein
VGKATHTSTMSITEITFTSLLYDLLNVKVPVYFVMRYTTCYDDVLDIHVEIMGIRIKHPHITDVSVTADATVCMHITVLLRCIKFIN